jgi:deoxyhypusine synthase
VVSIASNERSSTLQASVGLNTVLGKQQTKRNPVSQMQDLLRSYFFLVGWKAVHRHKATHILREDWNSPVSTSFLVEENGPV